MAVGDERRSSRRPMAPIVLVGGALMTVSALIFLGLVTFEDEQGRGLRALAGSSVDPATLPQTVPFRDVGGHLVVEAVIAGSEEPRPMLLDTGAPTFLSTDIADADPATPRGALAVTSAAGEVIESEVVSVPSMALGGASFTDVGAIRGFVGIGNPLYCLSPHGLIGANLMHDAVWQLDYASRALTIAASSDELEHVEGAIEVPFTTPEGASPSPLIELRVGTKTLPFLVDTGSDGWLAVHPADLEDSGVAIAPDSPRIASLVADASGQRLSILAWTAADVVIGDAGEARAGLALPALPIVVTEALSEGRGVLGNEFLAHFVLTIDWPRGVLHLDPIDAEPRPGIPASASITWNGTQLIVGSVVIGLPDDDETVATNAPVVAVDGHDVSDASLDEACALIRGGLPQAFGLTVLTDARHTIDVVPVDDFFEPLTTD